MKVKIGGYPSRLTCRIHTRYMDKKYGFLDWPKNQSKFESFLEAVEDTIQWLYTPINYFFDKRQQKVSVRIDPWDTWSMDHTLAPIILPMLKQLKETKHGAPWVAVEDVPKELRPTKKEVLAYTKKGEVDPKFFERWDWVMGEMIYAFDCKMNKDDVWMRFDSTQRKEMEAEQERISNGFRLFGKYYESLWD
jgi:hypothetical protein